MSDEHIAESLLRSVTLCAIERTCFICILCLPFAKIKVLHKLTAIPSSNFHHLNSSSLQEKFEQNFKDPIRSSVSN